MLLAHLSAHYRQVGHQRELTIVLFTQHLADAFQSHLAAIIHSQQFQFEIEFAPEKGTEKVVLEVLKNKDYQTTI